jgi:hypothetical protein
MLVEIKDTIILGCELLITGFVMVIAVGFALVAAPVLIFKYRDDIRYLHKKESWSRDYGI